MIVSDFLCRAVSQEEWFFEDKIIGGKFSRDISEFCDYSRPCSSILTRSDESSETRAKDPFLLCTSTYRDELKLHVILLFFSSVLADLHFF